MCALTIRSRALPATLLALLLAQPGAHAASGDSLDPQLAEWQLQPLSEAALDQYRGGFSLAEGLMIALGIAELIRIDGQLIAQQAWSILPIRLNQLLRGEPISPAQVKVAQRFGELPIAPADAPAEPAALQAAPTPAVTVTPALAAAPTAPAVVITPPAASPAATTPAVTVTPALAAAPTAPAVVITPPAASPAATTPAVTVTPAVAAAPTAPAVVITPAAPSPVSALATAAPVSTPAAQPVAAEPALLEGAKLPIDARVINRLNERSLALTTLIQNTQDGRQIETLRTINIKIQHLRSLIPARAAPAFLRELSRPNP